MRNKVLARSFLLPLVIRKDFVALFNFSILVGLDTEDDVAVVALAQRTDKLPHCGESGLVRASADTLGNKLT